jgi:hypothetical protein
MQVAAELISREIKTSACRCYLSDVEGDGFAGGNLAPDYPFAEG